MEFTFDGGKIVTAHIRGFEVKTDQPFSNGGTETAPSPFELYLASLGTCAAIYVKSFCDNRQISTEGIKLVQKTTFSPAAAYSPGGIMWALIMKTGGCIILRNQSTGGTGQMRNF
jgi:uncharacterized OsmC-like protein